jgi:sugar transferase (PEP-CTERM/EpsH1 system associated)
MKLIMVSPNIPSPTWGASTRNYYLLKALASKHSVSLLALGVDEDKGVPCDASLLEDLTRSVQVIALPKSSPKRWQQLVDVVRGKSYVLKAHTFVEMQDALEAALTSGHYDAVLFESVLMAGYHLPKGVKVIIDEHNIEYELRLRTYQHETALLRKWYNRLESSLLKPVEIERCRNADIVLVTSERERHSLQSKLPGSVIEVVQNGVDMQMFDGNNSAQIAPGRIIFTGSMEYYPNVHAVLFFAMKCWPLIRAQVPHATWQIVGKNPLPEVRRLAELPGVTVTGSVPDVRPYLATAEVAIVPLLIGSGTRLKILEALAMRKAVVSTTQGCEGLSVIPGKHLVVEDQPEAFAQAVVTFMNDCGIRNTFGNAGRELVEAEYSWERCGTELLNVIEKIS